MASPRVPSFLEAPESEARRGWASGVLLRYFLNRLSKPDRPRFTGAMFERLDGGGDRHDVANLFTPADLVAVSMLSVEVHREAAVRLLCTDVANLSELLGDVPSDLELADADDNVIALGSAADELWVRLRTYKKVGRTTTSKLLARKRPRLLPVWDSEIQALLELPDARDYWRQVRDLLGPADSARNAFLRAARDGAGLGVEVSVIRVFDVLCWMWQKGNTEPLPAP